MRIQSLFLALALTLSACGGGSDPAALNSKGYDAFNSGKYADAAGHFEAALDALGEDTSNPEYQKAQEGLIEANCYEDPERARDDFLAYARSSTTVDATYYSRIGSLLADAKHFDPAIDVVDAGIKAHPETPALMKVMDKIAAESKKSGDASAQSKLQGLGYLGD